MHPNSTNRTPRGASRGCASPHIARGYQLGDDREGTAALVRAARPRAGRLRRLPALRRRTDRPGRCAVVASAACCAAAGRGGRRRGSFSRFRAMMPVGVPPEPVQSVVLQPSAISVIPRSPELQQEMESFVADLPAAVTRPHPSTPPSAKRARTGPVPPSGPPAPQPLMAAAAASVPAPVAAVPKRAAKSPTTAASLVAKGRCELENTAQTIHGALAGFEGFVGLSDKKKGKPIDDAQHPYRGQGGTRDEQVAEALRWMQWSKLRAWSACRVTSVCALLTMKLHPTHDFGSLAGRLHAFTGVAAVADNMQGRSSQSA